MILMIMLWNMFKKNYNNMKNIIRLTENDIVRLVKRVLSEQDTKKDNSSVKTILFFDGNSLKWVENGQIIKTWKAVSGRTKYNTFGDKKSEELVKKFADNEAEFMKVKDQGPIPVGEYTIGEIQKRTNGNALNFNKGKSEKELFDIMMKTNKHDWNTGEPADLIAWGDYRMPISKSEGTETYGRGSFYVHGGGIPGSIGCIDLMNEINDFVSYFSAWKNKTKNNRIRLIVKY